MSQGRLSTPLAVREYLMYSIKLLELASKYTWPSILKYDDEFRVVQNLYGYAFYAPSPLGHPVPALRNPPPGQMAMVMVLERHSSSALPFRPCLLAILRTARKSVVILMQLKVVPVLTVSTVMFAIASPAAAPAGVTTPAAGTRVKLIND